MRFATTRKPVRPIPTRPPAARFLLRGRNRGKSAAGASPCTPGAAGAEAKGAKARRGKSGRDMRLSSADYTAGNARLPFRVVICRSAMFSVPRFPNRSLCFGLERRNGRTLASDRGPYANRIPRTTNRSGCFDLKRRSNRTQASIRGSYGNRGCAAREICDDGETCEVHSGEASGGNETNRVQEIGGVRKKGHD